MIMLIIGAIFIMAAEREIRMNKNYKRAKMFRIVGWIFVVWAGLVFVLRIISNV